uniref:Uncharacterized protein n=1 Tax=Setaria viridis TaxID=4556 RepID=A0A4U6TLK6_SETVI|nr:hypothetical protein SEVIR_7G028705v2 [Setaria viridis]
MFSLCLCCICFLLSLETTYCCSNRIVPRKHVQAFAFMMCFYCFVYYLSVHFYKLYLVSLGI